MVYEYAFAIGKIGSNFLLASSMPRIVLLCTSQQLNEAVVTSTTLMKVEETPDGHNLLQLVVSAIKFVFSNIELICPP